MLQYNLFILSIIYSWQESWRLSLQVPLPVSRQGAWWMHKGTITQAVVFCGWCLQSVCLEILRQRWGNYICVEKDVLASLEILFFKSPRRSGPSAFNVWLRSESVTSVSLEALDFTNLKIQLGCVWIGSMCSARRSETKDASTSPQVTKSELRFPVDMDVENLPCHYPFTYNGKENNMCIKSGGSNFWCSTSPEYASWSWRNCRKGKWWTASFNYSRINRIG